MHTWTQVRALLQTPLRRRQGGVEGGVYHCCDEIGIKVQHYLAFPSQRITVGLAERRRRSVQGFFQELLCSGALRYRRALYFFTWAMTLDGVSPYPTTPYHRLLDLPQTYNAQVSPSLFWRYVQADYKLRGGVEDHDAVREIKRLRSICGPQFEPIPFDYEEFSNHSNFGVSAELCADIQELSKRIAPAVDRMLSMANAPGRTDPIDVHAVE